jgi:hypothetical protein
MKRWAWLMVLAATAAPGCVMLPQLAEEPPKVEEAQRSPVERKKATPPVTAEDINDSNAKACFQRLMEEVERSQDAK